MTFLWDAFEFYRQHYRIQSGHAPANPDNPRYARILAGISSAAFVLCMPASQQFASFTRKLPSSPEVSRIFTQFLIQLLTKITERMIHIQLLPLSNKTLNKRWYSNYWLPLSIVIYICLQSHSL